MTIWSFEQCQDAASWAAVSWAGGYRFGQPLIESTQSPQLASQIVSMLLSNGLRGSAWALGMPQLQEPLDALHAEAHLATVPDEQ
jgi:hypothetical protein